MYWPCLTVGVFGGVGGFPGFRGLNDSLYGLTVVYGVYRVYVDKFVYRSLLNFH